MKKTLLLLMALATQLLAITANGYQFRHYDTNNGLSQSSVLAIEQDHTGFMWFGTRNGLNRFDGKTFRSYHRGNRPGDLGNEHINCLYRGPNNELWIGTAQGLYIYSDISDSFHRFSLKATDGSHISNSVNTIAGRGEWIYISCLGQGVFSYNTRTRLLTHQPLKDTPSIQSMTVAPDGTIWVGIYQSGLHSTRDRFQHLKAYHDATGATYMKGITIAGMVHTGRYLYLCTTSNGLHRLDLATRQSTPCLTQHDGKGLFAHALLKAGPDILMMTEVGLFSYNTQTLTQRFYQEEHTNPYSLSDDHLQTAFLDKEGGIWVGTYFGGVNYAPSMSFAFANYFPRIDVPSSLYGKRVRSIDEDSQQRIWVGTEDGGLGYFSPADKTFHRVALSAPSRNIQSLKVIGHELWVGAFQQGIEIIDTRTGRTLSHLRQGEGPTGLSDNNIFAIQPLHDGRVAIGSYGGIDVYNPATHTVSRVKQIPQQTVYAIKEDHLHNLWVAVYGYGIYMLPNGSRTWRRHTGGRQKLDNVVYLYEDTRGGLWATTEGYGTWRYSTRAHTFEPVPIPSYGPKRVVMGMTEDKNGKLWLTTNEGLIGYDAYTRTAMLFTTANGLLDNTFNQGSAFCSQSGKIYLGSQSGLTVFAPGTFKNTATPYTIVATALMVNGEPAERVASGSLLQTNITLTQGLSLGYDQNSFALKMAVLNYRDSQPHQLQYMLEGFDHQWQYLYNDDYIRYTNVPAGHYTLVVRNGASTTSQAYHLDITIRTPWWNSWWAWLLYVAAVGSLAYFAYRYLTQRQEMLHRMALNKFKYEKEKELYRSKINFFTNVAHEIRTPLTLIKCPLTDIMEHPATDDATRESLDIVDKNVNRLLDLTNQLLDFRKTEQAGLRLNLERCNIGELVRGVYVRFTSVMKKKEATHSLTLPDTPLYAYVDKESFTKIVSNLMNNAVKYGDKHITLTIDTQPQAATFSVTVLNDGPVIPPALRQKVFTPFFRAESATTSSSTGTGIGLAMARTLADLHGGTLDIADSEAYNIFVLTLPVGKSPTLSIGADDNATDAPSPSDTDTPQDTDTADTLADTADDDKVATIMIVEDNKAMQQYEKAQMKHLYHVLTADNGQQALEMLTQHRVDLIVSDAMMEPVDGFELCRQVKENVVYSHIPFILLTALTLDSAKIRGMESGADSYIEKPFSTEYLLNVMQNLLRTRESIKKAYATSPFTPQESVSISKADEAFIKRLKEVVAEHLKDSDFGITELASHMCMSRTNLNRKIRGTFNLTPNNYIKIERLKLAAQLMKEGNVKVNEVCYTVGFSSPSYFTQCFQKQFGLLPKDFITGATEGGEASPPEAQ